jgi:hypothetical protein
MGENKKGKGLFGSIKDRVKEYDIEEIIYVSGSIISLIGMVFVIYAILRVISKII